MRLKMILFFLVLFSAGYVNAQLKVAGIFGDHMVLQRGKPIAVWGWARRGSRVEGALGGLHATTVADRSGEWRMEFSKLEAGGPYTLTVRSAGQSVAFSDVMVGEVWLCSGQSNMEFRVYQVLDAEKAMAAADYPGIRQIRIPNEMAFQPMKDIDTGVIWKRCSPSSVGDFTAVGYFFAKMLSDSLHVPVGIINDCWGGAQLEGYLSRDAMLRDKQFRSIAENLPASWKESDARMEAALKKYVSAGGQWSQADESAYVKPGYDFSKWPGVYAPASWDWVGAPAFRGIGYSARTIELDGSWSNDSSLLSLGTNDAAYELYINGKKIVAQQQKNMLIQLPAGVWVAGQNSIVVKQGIQLEPDWMGVGLHGDKTQLYIEKKGERLNISGDDWHMMPSFSNPYYFAHLNNNVATTLYNAMIHPIVPFVLRGVLWYQGESNTARAFQYRTAFKDLIESWRAEWKDQLPFFFVQLASYGENKNSNIGSNWAELREAQAMALSLPMTGMAVATDVSEADNLHPKNKAAVGRRLGLQALDKVYGYRLPAEGPVFDTVLFGADKATVHFKQGTKLMVQGNYPYLYGFEMAGADRKFYYAEAKIKGNTVVVRSPEGVTPVAVRYNWADAPVAGNLFDEYGLPAAPFRTDDWPGRTDHVVFGQEIQPSGSVSTIHPSSVTSTGNGGAGEGRGARSANAGGELYKDANVPIDQRVQDLLSRMTLEEKVAQTWCLDSKNLLTATEELDTLALDSLLKDGIGEITTPGLLGGTKKAVVLANAIQRRLAARTRLGIPVIIHQESLHGSIATDATVFPSVLGMASSFDKELMREVYTEVAKEVRVRGSRQVLAPVVDIVRDPRWGRTEETIGEDPFLTSQLAVQVVKAYQGDQLYLDGAHVAATLKHFGVHGWNEGGVNVSPANTDERTIRNFFFPAFKACVQQANVMDVMPCYNEWSGMPWHANKKMLEGVLRNEWGFKGMIISDYGGITDLHVLHDVATSDKEAAFRAFHATVDVEAPDRKAYKYLPELIREGRITMQELDAAVSRVLMTKFRLGLFDHLYDDPGKVDGVLNDPHNKVLALKAARESMVLLKNKGSLLPLDPGKVKVIAVIGPNADSCLLGGYAVHSAHGISPLQAIRQRYGSRIKIVYSEGVRIIEGGDWWQDSFKLSDPAQNRQRIQAAVEVARQADVVVLCLGEHPVISREAWAKTHLGDLANLDLPMQQNELVDAIKATGKPTCAFIFSGPPLSFTAIDDKVDAITQCWYLGEQTGNAVADLLFGVYNPSGKLTISIPRSAGHLPVYYNHQPSARRGYNLDSISPLYPFGYGLSFTKFEYGQPLLSAPSMHSGDTIMVSVDVSNTGNRAGVEIAQLYVHQLYGMVARPVEELKGFQRVELQPGERKTVHFSITRELLSYYDPEMNFIAEPGDFEIMAGGSSVDLNKSILHLEK